MVSKWHSRAYEYMVMVIYGLRGLAIKPPLAKEMDKYNHLHSYYKTIN
jgi:hypothetical protein